MVRAGRVTGCDADTRFNAQNIADARKIMVLKLPGDDDGNKIDPHANAP
jgi:hypothetical protein